MARNPPITGATEIRDLRLRLQLSQPQFANLLGVSAETYRTWDSGRRAVPLAWLDKPENWRQPTTRVGSGLCRNSRLNSASTFAPCETRPELGASK